MIDELIKRFLDTQEGDYTWTPNGLKWETGWDDATEVDEEDLDSGRWQLYKLTILEIDGKLYGVEWSEGLTENQENEFYPSKSTIYEVDKTEKVVYTYKRKSS